MTVCEKLAGPSHAGGKMDRSIRRPRARPAPKTGLTDQEIFALNQVNEHSGFEELMPALSDFRSSVTEWQP
jgi:hypothetical protein